jgi:ABC-type tungstate transport system substrate-binding protein
MTTNDFLTSGEDGLWVPVAVASVVVLVLVWLHRALVSRLSEGARRRAFRVLIPVAGAAGAVLVGLALLVLVGQVRPLWGDVSEWGGLALAIGALLLVYAVRLVRLAPRAATGQVAATEQGVDAATVRRRAESAGLAEWGAAFLLVSVGLYWAVGNYA